VAGQPGQPVRRGAPSIHTRALRSGARW
jgi:hypothetical protein